VFSGRSVGLRRYREVLGGVGTAWADTRVVGECNDPVPCADVTVMRRATTKVGAAFGAVMVMAATGLACSQATSGAEPEPGAHQVRYTLTSMGPGDFNLYYAFAAPPSLEAYHADSNAFVKSEKINLVPGTPWVFETTLADSQWAFISASGAAHAMQADPNVRCEITVDGQPVADQTGPFATQCQLRSWN
jgi:hypothetical protein